MRQPASALAGLNPPRLISPRNPRESAFAALQTSAR